jgi:hypothetical protein
MFIADLAHSLGYALLFYTLLQTARLPATERQMFIAGSSHSLGYALLQTTRLPATESQMFIGDSADAFRYALLLCRCSALLRQPIAVHAAAATEPQVLIADSADALCYVLCLSLT